MMNYPLIEIENVFNLTKPRDSANLYDLYDCSSRKKHIISSDKDKFNNKMNKDKSPYRLLQRQYIKLKNCIDKPKFEVSLTFKGSFVGYLMYKEENKPDFL